MRRSLRFPGRSPRAGKGTAARAAALVAALVATSSCGQLFGPDDVAPPTFERMEVDLALGDGYFTIDAFPIDRQFRLRYGQRLAVEVRSSSGDRERVDLYRRWCPSRGGYGTYDCFRFEIMLRDATDLPALAERAEASGGRLALSRTCSASGCWSSGHFATVVLFSPDDLIDTARRARGWPGVEFVELRGPGGCAGWCAPLPYWQLAAPVRAAVGSAVIGDAVVQVGSGDTLMVSYRQPTGGTLTVRLPVP